MTRPSFWSPPSVACCDPCRHSEDIGWNQTSLGNRDSINVAFLVTGDEDSPCSMALPKKVDSIVEPCQICLFGEILLWKIGENCQFKFQIMNQSADFDVFGSTTGGSAVIGENYLGGGETEIILFLTVKKLPCGLLNRFDLAAWFLAQRIQGETTVLHFSGTASLFLISSKVR